MCSNNVNLQKVINLFFLVLFAASDFSCSKQQTSAVSDIDTFSSDIFIEDEQFSDNASSFFNDNVFFNDSNDTFIFDTFFPSDLENYVFDKYSEYVDGVYVTVLSPEEYNKALLVLQNGQELNINKIIKNIAIGSGTIVLTSILLPALAPGLAPRIAIIVTNIIKEALVGAALDAGMRGVTEYIKTGNKQNALYKAIEGASEGFMWGAIIASTTNSFSEIRLLQQTQNIDDTLISLSDNIDDVANRTDQWAHFNGIYLKPNQKYLFGNPPHSNIYVGYTDDIGRIKRIEAPNLQLKQQGRLKLKNNTNTPEKLPTDEAGHLIGDQFDGSPYLDNLVSMSQSVNHGSYYNLETEWANALKAGKKVQVYVNIEYSANALRPTSFHIEYTIDDEFFEKTILNIVEQING